MIPNVLLVAVLLTINYGEIYGQNENENTVLTPPPPGGSSQSPDVKTNDPKPSEMMSTSMHTMTMKPDMSSPSTPMPPSPLTCSNKCTLMKKKMTIKTRNYQSLEQIEVPICRGHCDSEVGVVDDMFEYQLMGKCCLPDSETAVKKRFEFKHYGSEKKANFTMKMFTKCSCSLYADEIMDEYRPKRERKRRGWGRRFRGWPRGWW